jgi:hypothetical protein
VREGSLLGQEGGAINNCHGVIMSRKPLETFFFRWHPVNLNDHAGTFIAKDFTGTLQDICFSAFHVDF